MDPLCKRCGWQFRPNSRFCGICGAARPSRRLWPRWEQKWNETTTVGRGVMLLCVPAGLWLLFTFTQVVIGLMADPNGR